MAVESRHMERRPAVLVRGLQLRVGGDQDVSPGHPPVYGGHVQRGAAVSCAEPHTGALADQQLETLLAVGGGGGEVQRGLTLVVDPVQLHGLALDHLLQDVHVAVERGRVQRRVARQVRLGQARPAVHQRRHGRQVADGRRHVDRGEEILVPGVEVCPGPRQQPHDLLVAVAGCPVQRPSLLLVQAVDVGAVADEDLHDVRVSRVGGVV